MAGCSSVGRLLAQHAGTHLRAPQTGCGAQSSERLGSKSEQVIITQEFVATLDGMLSQQQEVLAPQVPL